MIGSKEIKQAHNTYWLTALRDLPQLRSANLNASNFISNENNKHIAVINSGEAAIIYSKRSKHRTKHQPTTESFTGVTHLGTGVWLRLYTPHKAKVQPQYSVSLAIPYCSEMRGIKINWTELLKPISANEVYIEIIRRRENAESKAVLKYIIDSLLELTIKQKKLTIRVKNATVLEQVEAKNLKFQRAETKLNQEYFIVEHNSSTLYFILYTL